MMKYEYKVVTIATAFAMNTKQYEKMALDFETQLNGNRQIFQRIS